MTSLPLVLAAAAVTLSVAGCAGASAVASATVDSGGAPDGATPPLDGQAPFDLDAGAADARGDAGDSGGPIDAAPAPTYVNPVLARDFPDPFVLREGSTYYAFATNAAGKNVQAATSPDLAAWTALPDALPVLPAWAAKNAGLTWAPSVLKRGSGYVLYYTTRDKASGFQCVSRAESPSPAGPYVDGSSSPFVCQVSGSESLCGSIDPSPFVDPGGTPYLLWKSDENASQCATPPRLWSAPLSADGLTLVGPHTALLTMDQSWEKPIIEGPSMTAMAGLYFLVYSANAYESASYAMGYATCLSATGPCKKVTVTGPFVRSAGPALGPGGGEFFTDVGGATWLAYHAWTAPSTTYASGGARSLRIDRLTFDGGALALDGPTTTPRPLP